MTELEPEPPAQSLVPGVVRLAATAWWHTTEWTVATSVKASRRLLNVAIHPETAGELVRDVGGAARDLFGMTDLEERIRTAPPAADSARKVAESVPGAGAALRAVDSVSAGDVVRRVAEVVALPVTVREAGGQPDHRRNGAPGSLRSRGEELLHKSRDVRYVENAHPAYERLLDSLAPDEARVLRLMLLDGPQPAVDIRTGGPLGLISSRLIAPGLSMIGARAGLRYVERVPAYLNNLNRLGLIWFSRETLRDPMRYQVLEAQPDVLEAVHSVRQAKIVRRSIHLTPFGEGFCRASLVPDPQLLADLPEHASPEKPRRPQPPAASTLGVPER
jgi:Abortive infection alpha